MGVARCHCCGKARRSDGQYVFTPWRSAQHWVFGTDTARGLSSYLIIIPCVIFAFVELLNSCALRWMSPKVFTFSWLSIAENLAWCQCISMYTDKQWLRIGRKLENKNENWRISPRCQDADDLERKPTRSSFYFDPLFIAKFLLIFRKTYNESKDMGERILTRYGSALSIIDSHITWQFWIMTSCKKERKQNCD